MNKEELVSAVADKLDLTKKDITEVLNAAMDATIKAVKEGHKVTLVGFGTFEAKKRAARVCRNPKTGAEVKVAEKVVPTFKVGKAFKETVNK